MTYNLHNYFINLFYQKVPWRIFSITFDVDLLIVLREIEYLLIGRERDSWSGTRDKRFRKIIQKLAPEN